MAGAKFRPFGIPRSIEAFSDKRAPTGEELECEKHGYKLSRTTLGRGAYAKVKMAFATPAKLEKDRKLMKILRQCGDNKVNDYFLLRPIESKRFPSPNIRT